MSVEVCQATAEHAETLARCVRSENIAEMRACAGSSAMPIDVALESLEHSSLARTLIIGGEVAAIWGVFPETALGGRATVWVLAGDAADRHPIAFAKISRLALEELLGHFDLLGAFVDARYERSLRWARWLGFSVGAPQPAGAAGQPFCPIAIRARRAA